MSENTVSAALRRLGFDRRCKQWWSRHGSCAELPHGIYFDRNLLSFVLHRRDNFWLGRYWGLSRSE